MSCNISKFDFCMLQQETFTSPTFEFENTDVSNDTFVYTVFKSFGSAKKEFPVNFIDDNTVYIEEIKMSLGDYQHELLWIRNGIKEVVFQGSLKVTDKGSNCGCTSNKNIIKIVNEDVVVKVNYSERVIERITDKGPKGDSAYQVAVENGFVGTEEEWLESLKLHYSDLTEAEILELQQPAIEAAQTANQAADNANTATQNAITATDEANTATTNANNAATTANASAINADNSAGLATSAATNANDAATAANTAAAFANSQRGWTPIHVFEADGAQRQVKKLTDYIGGTGNKPTQNIGQYVIDGGYTSVKANATNFKGAQSDNLIYEYKRTENLITRVSNIDYATNTFTSISHGLANGVGVYAVPDFNVITDFTNVLESFLPITTASRLFRIINVTADTFQISDTTGGAVYPLTQKSTATISTFHFERGNASYVSINNLGNLRGVRVKMCGFLKPVSWLYLILTGEPAIGDNNVGIPRNPSRIVFNTNICFLEFEYDLTYQQNGYNTLIGNYSIIGGTTPGTMSNVVKRVWKNRNNLIDNQGVGLAEIFNDFQIKIYKL